MLRNSRLPLSRRVLHRRMRILFFRHAGGKFFFLFLYLSSAFLVSLLLQFVFMYFRLLPREESLIGGREIFFMILAQAFVFLFLGFVFVKKFRLRYFPAHVNFSVSLAEWGLRAKQILLAFFLYIGVMLIIGVLVKALNLQVDQFADYNMSRLRASPNYFLLAVALIAPLYEEIVFRGIVLRAFFSTTRQIGYNLQTLVAVFLSSLVFAFFHFDKAAFLPLFILSLYLAALTLYKKNIILSIFIHAVNNFFSGVGILYFIDKAI